MTLYDQAEEESSNKENTPVRHPHLFRYALRRRGWLQWAGAVLAAVMTTLAVPATAQAADEQITPAASAVTASTSDENKPANVVDNDYGTRWSGEGDGAWLQLDLGSTMTVSHIKLAVHKGTIRQNVFELQYWDGSRWVSVYDGESSGTTTDLESFEFEPVQTSKVRYLGHGYDGDGEGDWNSLTPPAHAADPQPRHDESSSQGHTLSLQTLPDSRVEAAQDVECSWSVDTYVEWWWDPSYTLTKVGAEAGGHVECDPDIYGIESELYVRHDATRIAVDTQNCVSDDGDECATSNTVGTHTCTAGTSCAGDWTSGLELRLQLDGDSWDADSFPDYCSIEGADDEVARCYLEVEPPIYVPPTFPPAAAATPAS